MSSSSVQRALSALSVIGVLLFGEPAGSADGVKCPIHDNSIPSYTGHSQNYDGYPIEEYQCPFGGGHTFWVRADRATTPASGVPGTDCPRATNGWQAVGCALQEAAKTLAAAPRSAPVPVDRGPVPHTVSPSSDPNLGKVYVYRTPGGFGWMRSPSVYVDNIELARLSAGHFFSISLPAGWHAFKPNNDNSGASAQVFVSAGQVKFVRLDMYSGGFVHGYTAVLTEDSLSGGSTLVPQLMPVERDKIKHSAVLREP